jgi:hypothetical protein
MRARDALKVVVVDRRSLVGGRIPVTGGEVQQSNVCVRCWCVGAGLARCCGRAGGDDERLEWDVWPGNRTCVRRRRARGSGLKAGGSWGGGTREQQQNCTATCQ